MSKKLKEFWSGYNFIVIFIAIFAAYLIINGSETSWTTITNIFLHSAILGTIALGQGMIVLTGDIDLSVGSNFVLAGGLTIMLFNATNSVFLTLLCALVLGGAFGFINGLFIGKFKMPSFIVTLATMLIYRSLSQYMMNEKGWTRYSIDATKSRYRALFNFGNGKLFTISYLAIVFVLLAFLLMYVTDSTKYGKRVYAVGSNEKAARLAGVNVAWTRISVFVIAGLCTGLATFLKIAKDTSFDPATSGKNYELYSIAAVVIGGISMSGGKGKVLGIIFGTMSFTLIDKIITALGMNALLNDTVKGIILLIAVGLQMVQRRSKD
ncbi:ABC transporter permease [Porcincola intestinalis]|uniref:ABC transporter permease n=1 Tax=Porcincola intestinalis TaxID=2606632 RepID=UPI0023F51934|nr:ABC transporter permease [Porcincola intestinalis]MCI6766459.1 ABC transporter permease [Lachnospiraceae bacterium]MDD7059577.1 ABC transporter permease [Porcincola intestinalis]MDY5283825.1 ABC transporter permease [Porcincola intestinalis]MDY5579295.1 ABC transporter permease [Porcincola intestinalis]